jgi:hypothetical protein
LGRRLVGHCRILATLGEDVVGEVYRATRTKRLS